MYPDPDPRIAQPVPVVVQNWDANKTVKPPRVRNTSVRTYVVDPANVNAKNVQITDYEPNRLRMAIWVIDSPVTLVVDSPPVTSPDASTSSSAPGSGGAYLPQNTYPYVFYGPDAWWLNALSTVTRVVVVKEYGD